MTDYGNNTWQHFQNVIKAARGEGAGRLPRGAAQLGAFPTGDASQLPGYWLDDVRQASHVVYHYGTPVAWIDERDGGWVVPDVRYSPSTTGCQNRIRASLNGYRTEPRGY